MRIIGVAAVGLFSVIGFGLWAADVFSSAPTDADAPDVPRPVATGWPTFRADAGRSGYTADRLPASMSLKWSWRAAHRPQPAWPRDDRMTFDRANRVVVADGVLYFGSSADDAVRALDATTGTLKWTFFTDGPVRFAPTVWKDRLFVVSDDGWLYCLDAREGTLIDRWRGGPADDRVLGNSRIVSKWPARGGPVIRDGVLYWGAGIWQSEGISLYAMNPDTGEILWRNDDSGDIDMPQPHGGARAKSGVSAQGYLLAGVHRLFVPTGRAVPAAFTRANGEFEYYRLQQNAQLGGTRAVLVNSRFYNGGFTYRTEDGSLLADGVNGVVAATESGLVHGAANHLRALRFVMKETTDRRGETVTVPAHEPAWIISNVPSGTALISAGNTIVTSGGNRVAAVDVNSHEVLWEKTVDDVAWDLAAAGGRLYVSTASGTIYCFSDDVDATPVAHQSVFETAPYGANEPYAEAAREIIDQSGITEGYCLDLSCGDGALAYELARQTDLSIVAVDSDPDKVATAREKLEAAGLYGARVSVQCVDPAESRYPKFFANLIVSGRSISDGPGVVDAGEVLRMQRPWGGVACLGKPGAMVLSRRGPLDDAGDWTHLYSNAANTLCSTDSIKGPLSVLWFRDIDLDVPQRHGRGPSPLFHEGRLFAEGLNGVLAIDAYNGRPLWRFRQQGILDAYNADHLAGTAITGSNMCIAGDSLFLRNADRCYRIDAATGELQSTYTAPALGDGSPSTWGYIACEDGILFGSIANTEHIVRHAYLRADEQMREQFSESSAIFAIDVASGELLWRYDAEKSIRHNAIAVGDGRVFLIDRDLALGDLLSRAAARRGEKPTAPGSGQPTGRLVTLDARTGKQIWDQQDDIFGTTLSFSSAHSVLLMSYQPTRFSLPSEVGGRMAAFHTTDGYRIWERKVNYTTRPLLNDRTIIAWPSALDLLTGEAQPFEMVKSYGCGQLSGSTNLLLFRSGTLGYKDSTRDAGTENFGGIRPGCWINALPVGGLVLVPDASAGCQCSYQNRSWVALQGSE